MACRCEDTRPACRARGPRVVAQQRDWRHNPQSVMGAGPPPRDQPEIVCSLSRSPKRANAANQGSRSTDLWTVATRSPCHRPAMVFFPQVTGLAKPFLRCLLIGRVPRELSRRARLKNSNCAAWEFAATLEPGKFVRRSRRGRPSAAHRGFLLETTLQRAGYPADILAELVAGGAHEAARRVAALRVLRPK
jgi:hypothetical protein